MRNANLSKLRNSWSFLDKPNRFSIVSLASRTDQNGSFFWVSPFLRLLFFHLSWNLVISQSRIIETQMQLPRNLTFFARAKSSSHIVVKRIMTNKHSNCLYKTIHVVYLKKMSNRIVDACLRLCISAWPGTSWMCLLFVWLQFSSLYHTLWLPQTRPRYISSSQNRTKMRSSFEKSVNLSKSIALRRSQLRILTRSANPPRDSQSDDEQLWKRKAYQVGVSIGHSSIP
jgi:hypothetical protein